MSNPSLQLTSGTFDRMAAQQQLFNQSLVDMSATGGGKFYPRVHTNIAETTPNGDPDVEVPLVGSANSLDENYKSGTFLSSIYSKRTGSSWLLSGKYCSRWKVAPVPWGC